MERKTGGQAGIPRKADRKRSLSDEHRKRENRTLQLEYSPTFFETRVSLNSKWFTACRTLVSRFVPSITDLDAYISHHRLNALLLHRAGDKPR